MTSQKIEKFLRETSIDADMENLLERNRQGENFNLYDELEKLGYSEEEIFLATIRKMKRMSEDLNKIKNTMIAQAIIENLFGPDDLKT